MSRNDNQLIGPIASFIGARLQYPYPHINGQGNPWVSTIKVEQHKEKFFAIRIYCTIAEPDLIKQYWDWLKAREARKDAGEQFYTHMRQNFIDMIRQNDAPTEDFVRRCLKHDAIHYRKCYREMVALQPHLESKICGQADHTELLWPQHQEVSAYLDQCYVEKPDTLVRYYGKYHVEDLQQLKDFLKVVYEPSMRDYIELRD